MRAFWGACCAALSWVWETLRWPVRAAILIIGHSIPVFALISVFFGAQWYITHLSGEENPEVFPGVPLKYIILILDALILVPFMIVATIVAIRELWKR